MKRIILSVAVIAVTVGALLGGTTAFFSDVETSSANTFTAGALDLKVDNESYYNGNKCAEVTAGVWQWTGESAYPVPGTPCTTSWTLTDLDEGKLFFDFTDVKPDDEGEDTISLHVQNDAYACMDITLNSNDDNSSNEPELKTGDAPEDTLNDWDGELAQAIQMLWWADDGDNVHEVGEAVISGGVKTLMDLASTSGAFSVALADATHNVWGTPGPIPAEETAYIAKAWCFGTLAPAPLPDDADTGPLVRGTGVTCDGKTLGNVTQTDTATLDIEFRTEQARHNGRFLCKEDEPAPKDGTLTVTKVINGGDAAFDDFSFVVNTESPTPFDGSGSNSLSVAPGTYDVVETPAEGYTTTYANSQNNNANCDDLVIPSEGNVTCTITNTFVPVTGTLLVKKVLSGAPQDTDVTNFSFTVNGELSSFDGDAENAFVLPPGNYDVVEVSDDNFTATYQSPNGANCEDVTVVAGETVTCTITNTYDPTTITIEKIVVGGGTMSAEEFSFELNNVSASINTAYVVEPGAHLVEEVNTPADYVVTYGGACDTDGNISVLAHESKTCTITNTYSPTTLTITKNVVGGTANENDFSYTLNGNPTVLGPRAVTPDTYTVGEVATDHYVASYGGDCDAGGQVTLSANQSKTCTITNTYDPTTITITKSVVGGTANADDFTYRIDGTAVPRDTANLVTAGGHTVTETDGPANYVATFSGDCDANGGITAVAHENKTCAITNTFVQPTGTLSITKFVVGGPFAGQPQAFSFQIDGGSATAFDADSTSTVVVNTGTYDVTEPAVTNYVTSYWNGTSATCNDLVVTQGGTTKCWITNTYAPTTITIQKTVIGGTATSGSFTYRIDGNAVPLNTANVVNAGAHTVTETGGPANYVATFGGSCNSQGQITAVANQNRTCTITNTFVPPAPTSLFFDGFGTGNSDTSFDESPTWTEGGNSGNDADKRNSAGGGDESISDGDGGRKAAMVGENGYICRTMTTTGYNTLVLAYQWRGDSQAEVGDNGIVEYKTSGNCSDGTGWANLATHSLTTTTWQSNSVNLPGALNNTTFLLRFRVNSSQPDEDFRIDGVSLTGVAI